MKRFFLALALSLAIGSALPAQAQNGFLYTAQGSGGVAAPIACDKSVVINATATAQLVALAAGQAIYVCGGFLTLAGTTPSLAFEYGTGATCATGTTLLTGTMLPPAGSFLNFTETGIGTVMRTPVGTALCIVLGGTTPSAQGILTYAQF